MGHVVQHALPLALSDQFLIVASVNELALHLLHWQFDMCGYLSCIQRMPCCFLEAAVASFDEQQASAVLDAVVTVE